MGKLNHRLAGILIGGLFVCCGWFVVRSRLLVASDHETASAPLLHGDTLSSKAPTPAVHRTWGENRASSGQRPRPGRPPAAEVIHPELQHVLDDNPDIAQYRWLERKALPTAEQLKSKQDMLSDSELIETAKFDLIASGEEVFVKEAEIKRMFRVQFLADALEWTGNPERGNVMGAVDDVILAANLHADAPEELRQSLAGDKVELYINLQHTDPGHAEDLMKKAAGTDLEPLLSYARDRYHGEVLAMREDEHH